MEIARLEYAPENYTTSSFRLDTDSLHFYFPNSDKSKLNTIEPKEKGKFASFPLEKVWQYYVVGKIREASKEDQKKRAALGTQVKSLQ